MKIPDCPHCKRPMKLSEQDYMNFVRFNTFYCKFCDEYLRSADLIKSEFQDSKKFPP